MREFSIQKGKPNYREQRHLIFGARTNSNHNTANTHFPYYNKNNDEHQHIGPIKMVELFRRRHNWFEGVKS